jgi:DNA-damage-inducible protein J
MGLCGLDSAALGFFVIAVELMSTCGYIRATAMRNTMPPTDTIVRARIDAKTKKRASDALKAMGLSISDAIRLLMLRIADERRLPFEVKAPNAASREAMAELAAGKGKRLANRAALLKELDI